MSETPKFTVIDRRKFKAEEEQETQQTPQPETMMPQRRGLKTCSGRRIPASARSRLSALSTWCSSSTFPP